MESKESVPPTDSRARTPLGIGESITRQGNTVALHRSEQARRADRRQGSVDPKEPGPVDG
jgi:hypothetical protein